MNSIKDNTEDVKKENINNLKLKENNSSFENYDDDELDDIINKDLIFHFPEEKTSDDIKKLYEEFHLEGTKEIKKDIEVDKEFTFERKLESEIEEILIEIFNNRIKNNNKKNYSFINKSKNKIKNLPIKNKNNFNFKIISLLFKKLSSLISYIKNKVNFEKIEKSDLDNIKQCLILCSQDINEIFEPSLDKKEKSEIENLLLKLFNDNILSDEKIINILKVKEELNLKNKFEISNNIDLNYNDVNKKNEINYNTNNINNNFFYNNNRNVINGVITSNSLLKGYQGIKKYENIDDLVEYINEEDKKKKSRKKKKKNKNKNNEKEINENIIKGSENNENIEVEIQDPIVENFKKNINNFSYNDSNQKIKPIFSKKWLKNLKIENN